MEHKRRALMTALGLLLGSFIGLSAANSLGAQGNTNLPADLQVLIAEASKANPEIKQMAELRSATKETIRSADALEDPKVGFTMKDIYAQGIIPQARQAAEASLASYQVGALAFAQLYQNQIAVYNVERALQEYLKDFEENWAELEWLVGEELPRRPGGRK